MDSRGTIHAHRKNLEVQMLGINYTDGLLGSCDGKNLVSLILSNVRIITFSCLEPLFIYSEISSWWAKDRDQWHPLVNMVMNLQFPQKARNFLTRWVTVKLSWRTLLHGGGY